VTFTTAPPILTSTWMWVARPWYQPGKTVVKVTRPLASVVWMPRRKVWPVPF
jgi:hypothetical protein